MISIYPLSGIKNSTEFTFQLNPTSYCPFINWGDDNFSNTNTSTHIYSSIGLYEIFAGTCSSTSSFYVSVYDGNFFTDKISVERNAVSSIVSCPYTFYINLSSKDKINTVLLYASGSNSSPYIENRNFWSHLTPEWSFSVNDKPISELQITGTPVYSGNHILGYSAVSSVQFKDDLPGNLNLCFTVIKKEQDIPLNSRVYSCLSHSICAVTPDKLFITSDGINSLNPIQWIGKDIPIVISVGSSQNSCTNILHYASGSIVDIKLSSTCSNINSNYTQYTLTQIKSFDDNCFPTGGYCLTSINYNELGISQEYYTNNLNDCKTNHDKIEFLKKRDNIENVTITASAIIYDECLVKENIEIFIEEDASFSTLTGHYIDLQGYDNGEQETVRFWFTANGYPLPPEPENPGRLIQVDVSEKALSDPPEANRNNVTTALFNALIGDLYFSNVVQGGIDTPYTIKLMWPEYGPIENSFISSTSFITSTTIEKGSLTCLIASISGQSIPFDLIAFENRHDFYRKGEDYNLYEILKNSLPFDLNQYSNFNNYLSSVAGQGDSFGIIYDKIHNFTKDHYDIETCTYDVLNNKSYMFDSSIDDFGLELPEELKRLFNFSTIPLQKLTGTRCVCNTNFTECNNCYASNVCGVCKFDKRSNLGQIIHQNDYISAGEIVLYKDTGGKIYNFFSIRPQNKDVYQLKELSSFPVNYGNPSDFCFYRWDKTSQGNPIQSIINYNDERNRLSPSLSSNDDWYGDNGIIEEMFNFVLNKNLIE